MVKEMVLLKKKEGVSREEFLRKYEEELVPLILKLCPSIKKYARNYVRTPLTAPDPSALPFDCITEVWYEDMEAFKAFAQLAMSEKGKVIFDLEGTFMDTSKTVAVLVRETGV
jgi:hypothetical protein